MAGLVSIVTPCFNGERFLHRLLDSILTQSYRPIEVIFIDDGSTDNTSTLVKEYVDKFDQKGIVLRYYYQDNGGQASALNRGLKLFNGDYLTWPDSDDFYNCPGAIEKMVDAFESIPQVYGLVRCDADIVEETSLKSIGRFSDSYKTVQKGGLFEDCLMENQFYYVPGCYMTKRSVIEDVISDKEIFVNRGGQNWQMFLPILYKYKCYFIADALFSYLVRKSSHSRENGSYLEAVERSVLHQQILLETLRRIKMPSPECALYSEKIRIKYDLQRLKIAFKFTQKDDFIKLYSDCCVKHNGKLPIFFKIARLVFAWPKLIRCVIKLRDLIRS